MKGEVISQIGTATIKIPSTFQRDCEVNAIRGDGAEGMFQETQRTNLPAVDKLLQCYSFSTEIQYNHQQAELLLTLFSVFQKCLLYTKGMI